jgi:hypothetical protein
MVRQEAKRPWPLRYGFCYAFGMRVGKKRRAVDRRHIQGLECVYAELSWPYRARTDGPEWIKPSGANN